MYPKALYGLVIAVMAWCVSSAPAQQTLHLTRQGTWETVSAEGPDAYMLEVSRLKKLIHSEQDKQVRGLLEQLTERYPELAGPDYDAFVEGEMEYARGYWSRAAKQYNEFLNEYPTSWLYDAGLERLYSIGTGFLNGRKRKLINWKILPSYDDGVEIMYGIADRAGDAPIAKRALVTLARTQQERDRYFEAYETWADIHNRWPIGPLAQESTVGMAMSLHSSYIGPDYDATPLTSAQTYYQLIQQRYPQEADQNDIEEKLDTTREQMAWKQYQIAEYYQRSNHPQAASLYYQYVADEWPDSTAGKLAQRKIEMLQAGQDPLPPKDMTRKAFDQSVEFIDSVLGIIDF